MLWFCHDEEVCVLNRGEKHFRVTYFTSHLPIRQELYRHTFLTILHASELVTLCIKKEHRSTLIAHVPCFPPGSDLFYLYS